MISTLLEAEAEFGNTYVWIVILAYMMVRQTCTPCIAPLLEDILGHLKVAQQSLNSSRTFPSISCIFMRYSPVAIVCVPHI